MAAKEIANQLINTFLAKRKIFIIGNGGSAAQSSHFSAEFINKYKRNRLPLPALALNDPANLTSIANDRGYKYVFSRQLEALANPRDTLICLSTSGKSANVNYAAKKADKLGVGVIDFPRNGKTVGEIQDNQLKLMHQVCEIVEDYFCDS